MQKNKDPLAFMRKQVQRLILERYPTVEQFCWAKNLNKATVSNFLHGKKDFQISTLAKIANALGMSLKIRLS
jgi:predicted transcriptional regulator